VQVAQSPSIVPRDSKHRLIRLLPDFTAPSCLAAERRPHDLLSDGLGCHVIVFGCDLQVCQ
jgi:hypothetical protein